MRMPATKPWTQFAMVALALLAGASASSEGRPYVAVAFGFAAEEVNADSTGVNHPTRCDRLLYAAGASVPDDAACSDNSPRRMFGDAFDLDGAFAGMANAGYAWDRIRIEAEFVSRGHGGATVPALAAAGNAALSGKTSEWNPNSLPFLRLSNFRASHAFVNLHYAFDLGAAWTPTLGVGLGLASVNATYEASFLRRTLADGYVTAVGGDPAQPEDWQVAAAGSASVLEHEMEGNVFGYQIIAGLERALSDDTDLFLSARWSAFDALEEDGLWTTVRSHAPMQADGVTPFTTRQSLDDIGGVAVFAGIRHAF